MQLSGLFNSGLPVKVVGTIIVGGVVCASVVYLHRRWRIQTTQITSQTTPQTTPASVQMTTIDNNVEEQTATPVSENTTNSQ